MLFLLYLIIAEVMVDGVQSSTSRPFVCNPHFNCLTCINPYDCETCGKGTFYHRAGAHYECALCAPNCVACSYYHDCQECVKGKFGKGCESDCSPGCADRQCEQATGICICKENFEGATCEECTVGRYGPDCDLMCSPGCHNDVCVKATGECVCKPGYTGLNCSECSSSRYGRTCENDCSKGCMDGTCDQKTGQCVCRGDFIGEKCDNCLTGHYGLESNCSLKCPPNCIACHSSTHCMKCKPRYMGDTCDLLYTNCTENLMDCSPGDVKCESNKQLESFANNCTGNCTKHCTICTGSGEHVECQQCETGRWDSNCLKTCPAMCRHGECNMKNGTCKHGCQPGYHGDHCQCYKNNICSVIGDHDTKNGALMNTFPLTRVVIAIVCGLVLSNNV